jgi:hypothetical protein
MSQENEIEASDYSKEQTSSHREERLVMPLRVLRLTLEKKWFDMIASGEKLEEYREPKAWIFSRLAGKEYDVVEFANGYGPNVPTMEVEYRGWELRFGGRGEWGAVSNQRYAVIHLGRVISRHNVERTCR